MQYTEEEFIDILKPFKKVTMYHQLDTAIEIPKPVDGGYL